MRQTEMPNVALDGLCFSDWE